MSDPFNDFIHSSSFINEKDLTEDDMANFCARFFDMQMARFQGHSLTNTILTCPFVYKKYDIKNDYFAAVIQTCIAAVINIERFAAKCPIELPNRWYKVTSIEQESLRLDVFFDNFRKLLCDSLAQNPKLMKITQFAIFELELSKYINNLNSNDQQSIPVIPELGEIHDSPEFSSLLSKALNDQQKAAEGNEEIFEEDPISLPTHSEALQIYHDLMSTLEELRLKHEENVSNSGTYFNIRATLKWTYDWRMSHLNSASFATIAAYNHIFPDSQDHTHVFGITDINITQIYIADLQNSRVPRGIIEDNTFRQFAQHFSTYISQLLTIIILPPNEAPSQYFNRLSSTLNSINSLLKSIEDLYITKRLIPPAACPIPWSSDQRLNSLAIGRSITNWSRIFTVDIVLMYIRDRIYNGAYNLPDYCDLFQTIGQLYLDAADAHYKLRLLDSATFIKSKQKNTKGNRGQHDILAISVFQGVSKKKTEDVFTEAASMYMFGAEQLLRAASKCKAVLLEDSDLLALGKTVEKEVLGELAECETLKESGLSEINNLTPDVALFEHLKEDAEKKFQQALNILNTDKQHQKMLIEYTTTALDVLAKISENTNLQVTMEKEFPVFSLKNK